MKSTAGVSGVGARGGVDVGVTRGDKFWEEKCLLLQEELKRLSVIVEELKSENVAL